MKNPQSTIVNTSWTGFVFFLIKAQLMSLEEEMATHSSILA